MIEARNFTASLVVVMVIGMLVAGWSGAIWGGIAVTTGGVIGYFTAKQHDKNLAPPTPQDEASDV